MSGDHNRTWDDDSFWDGGVGPDGAFGAPANVPTYCADGVTPRYGHQSSAEGNGQQNQRGSYIGNGTSATRGNYYTQDHLEQHQQVQPGNNYPNYNYDPQQRGWDSSHQNHANYGNNNANNYNTASQAAGWNQNQYNQNQYINQSDNHAGVYNPNHQAALQHRHDARSEATSESDPDTKRLKQQVIESSSDEEHERALQTRTPTGAANKHHHYQQHSNQMTADEAWKQQELLLQAGRGGRQLQSGGQQQEQQQHVYNPNRILPLGNQNQNQQQQNYGQNNAAPYDQDAYDYNQQQLQNMQYNQQQQQQSQYQNYQQNVDHQHQNNQNLNQSFYQERTLPAMYDATQLPGYEQHQRDVQETKRSREQWMAQNFGMQTPRLDQNDTATPTGAANQHDPNADRQPTYDQGRQNFQNAFRANKGKGKQSRFNGRNDFRALDLQNAIVGLSIASAMEQGDQADILPEIPPTFSKDTYTKSFAPYLLQEVRAHVAHGTSSLPFSEMLKGEIRFTGKGKKLHNCLSLECDFLGEAKTMMDGTLKGRDFGEEDGIDIGQETATGLSNEEIEERKNEKEKLKNMTEAEKYIRATQSVQFGSKEFEKLFCLNDVCVLIPKKRYSKFIEQCKQQAQYSNTFAQGYFDKKLREATEAGDEKIYESALRDLLSAQFRNFKDFLLTIDEFSILAMTVPCRVTKEIATTDTEGNVLTTLDSVSSLAVYTVADGFAKILQEAKMLDGGNSYQQQRLVYGADGRQVNLDGQNPSLNSWLTGQGNDSTGTNGMNTTAQNNSPNATNDNVPYPNFQSVEETYDDDTPPEVRAAAGMDFVLIRMSNIITQLRVAKALEQQNGENAAFFETELSGMNPVQETIVNTEVANVFRAERDERLDESQNLMIDKALTKERGITVVQGPPGTGKTKAAQWLLLCLTEKEDRIMATGPTNQSVEELASNYLQNPVVREMRRKNKRLLNPLTLPHQPPLVEVIEDFSKDMIVCSRNKMNVNTIETKLKQEGTSTDLSKCMIYKRGDELVVFLLRMYEAVDQGIEMWTKIPLSMLLESCYLYYEEHKNRIAFGNVEPQQRELYADGTWQFKFSKIHLCAKAVIQKGKLADVVMEFMQQKILRKLWELRKELEPHIVASPQNIRLMSIRRVLEDIWPSVQFGEDDEEVIRRCKSKWSLIKSWKQFTDNIVQKLRDPARHATASSAAAGGAGASTGNSSSNQELDVAQIILEAESSGRLADQYGRKRAFELFGVDDMDRGWVDLNRQESHEDDDTQLRGDNEDSNSATSSAAEDHGTTTNNLGISSDFRQRVNTLLKGKGKKGKKGGKKSGKNDRSAYAAYINTMATTRYAEIRKTLRLKEFCGKDPEEVSTKNMKMFMQDSRVIFCTVSVGGRGTFEQLYFSCVLIDEAGMVPEAESAIVIKDTTRRLILIGDPQQLRATVMSNVCQNCLYARSLMERLMNFNGFPAHRLRLEYRMEREIMAFPNKVFYENVLQISKQVRERRHPCMAILRSKQDLYDAQHIVPALKQQDLRQRVDEDEEMENFGQQVSAAAGNDESARVANVATMSSMYKSGRINCFQTLVWIDTSRLNHRQDIRTGGRSFTNPKEVDLIIDHVKRLNRNVCLLKRIPFPKNKSIQPLLEEFSIGITSPYAAQVELLRETVQSEFGFAQATERIKIRSIDGFQGGEADIMLISCVRSNEKKVVGFCKNPARLNVALTRARLALHIFGDSETLSLGDPKHWKLFVDFLREKELIFDLAARQHAKIVEKDVTGRTREALRVVENALNAGNGLLTGEISRPTLTHNPNLFRGQDEMSALAMHVKKMEFEMPKQFLQGTEQQREDESRHEDLKFNISPNLNKLRWWMDPKAEGNVFAIVFSEFAQRWYNAGQRLLQLKILIAAEIAGLVKGEKMRIHPDSQIRNFSEEELVNAAAEHLQVRPQIANGGATGVAVQTKITSSGLESLKSMNKRQQQQYDQMSVDILWHMQIDTDTGKQLIVVWNIVHAGQFKQARAEHLQELRRFKTEYLRDCLVRKTTANAGTSSGSAGDQGKKGAGKKGTSEKQARGVLVVPYMPIDERTQQRKYKVNYDHLKPLSRQEYGELLAKNQKDGMSLNLHGEKNTIGISRTKLYDVHGAQAMRLLMADKPVILPLKLSQEEKQAVRHPRSIFVHGRAGTGKTQVLVARGYEHQTMWIKELEDTAGEVEHSTTAAALPPIEEELDEEKLKAEGLSRMQIKMRILKAQQARKQREKEAKKRTQEREKMKKENLKLVLFVTASPTLAMQVKKFYDGLLESYLVAEKNKDSVSWAQRGDEVLKKLNMEKQMDLEGNLVEGGATIEEVDDDVDQADEENNNFDSDDDQNEKDELKLLEDLSLSDYDDADFLEFDPVDEQVLANAKPLEHFRTPKNKKSSSSSSDNDDADTSEIVSSIVSTPSSSKTSRAASSTTNAPGSSGVVSSADVVGTTNKDVTHGATSTPGVTNDQTDTSGKTLLQSSTKSQHTAKKKYRQRLGTNHGATSATTSAATEKKRADKMIKDISNKDKTDKEKADEEELVAAYAEASVGIGFAPLTPQERQKEVARMPKTFSEIRDRAEHGAASLITNYLHFLQVLDASIDDDEEFFRINKTEQWMADFHTLPPDENRFEPKHPDSEVNFRRFCINYYDSLRGGDADTENARSSSSLIPTSSSSSPHGILSSMGGQLTTPNSSSSSLDQLQAALGQQQLSGGNIGLKELVRGVAAVPDASQLFKEFHIIKGDYPPETRQHKTELDDVLDMAEKQHYGGNARTTAHRVRPKLMEGNLGRLDSSKAKDKYGRRHRDKDAEIYLLQKEGKDVDTEQLQYIDNLSKQQEALKDPLSHIGETLTQKQYVDDPPAESLLQNASRADREKVYKAFEKYEAHKRKRNEWDMNDCVSKIWERLSWRLRRRNENEDRKGLLKDNQLYNGPLVSCLLSDESQDLSILQMLLFALVCQDPNAFTFAHDPAQCIAEGRVFKHARLKDLWHGLYKKILKQANVEGDTEEERQQKERDFKVEMPAEIHLTRNFRAPQRILNMAQVLVEICKHFWPKRIDEAAPEISYERGELPTMVVGVSAKQFRNALLSAGADDPLLSGQAGSIAEKNLQDAEKALANKSGVSKKKNKQVNLQKVTSTTALKTGNEGTTSINSATSTTPGAVVSASTSTTAAAAAGGGGSGKNMFNPATNSGGGITTFGADQVVLVGTEEEKNFVDQLLGDRGIVVLLPAEAKGLEFNDVILWNLVSRSGVDGEREEKVWTVLFDFMRACLAQSNVQQLREDNTRNTGRQQGRTTSNTAAAASSKQTEAEQENSEDFPDSDDLEENQQTDQQQGPKKQNYTKEQLDVILDQFEQKVMKKQRQGDSKDQVTELWNTRLKELIVCITRAKKRLVIYETDATSTAVRMFQTLYHEAPQTGLPLSKRQVLDTSDVESFDDDIPFGGAAAAGASPAEMNGKMVLGKPPTATIASYNDALASCGYTRDPLCSLVTTVEQLGETEAVVDFPRKSSKQEYLRRGQEYYNNEQFVEAERMYRVGGNIPLALWAKAAGAEQKARDVGVDVRRLNDASRKERMLLFRESAQFYMQVWTTVAQEDNNKAAAQGGGGGTTTAVQLSKRQMNFDLTQSQSSELGERALRQAAISFGEAEDWKCAAEAYEMIASRYLQRNSEDTRQLFSQAADCYRKMHLFERAGDSFKKAGNDKEALKSFRDGRLWHRALDYFENPGVEKQNGMAIADSTFLMKSPDLLLNNNDNELNDSNLLNDPLQNQNYFDDSEFRQMKIQNAKLIARRIAPIPNQCSEEQVLAIKLHCATILEQELEENGGRISYNDFGVFLDDHQIRKQFYEEKQDWEKAADAHERCGEIFTAMEITQNHQLKSSLCLKYKRLTLARDMNDLRTWFAKNPDKMETIRANVMLTNDSEDGEQQQPLMWDAAKSNSDMEAAELELTILLKDVGARRGVKMPAVHQAAESIMKKFLKHNQPLPFQHEENDGLHHFICTPMPTFRTTIYLAEAFKQAVQLDTEMDSKTHAQIFYIIKDLAFKCLYGMSENSFGLVEVLQAVQKMLQGGADGFNKADVDYALFNAEGSSLARNGIKGGSRAGNNIKLGRHHLALNDAADEMDRDGLAGSGSNGLLNNHQQKIVKSKKRQNNRNQFDDEEDETVSTREVLFHDFFAREIQDEILIAFNLDAEAKTPALVEPEAEFYKLCEQDLLRAEVTVFEVLLQMCLELKSLRQSRCPKEAICGRCPDYHNGCRFLHWNDDYARQKDDIEKGRAAASAGAGAVVAVDKAAQELNKHNAFGIKDTLEQILKATCCLGGEREDDQEGKNSTAGTATANQNRAAVNKYANKHSNKKNKNNQQVKQDTSGAATTETTIAVSESSSKPCVLEDESKLEVTEQQLSRDQYELMKVLQKKLQSSELEKALTVGKATAGLVANTNLLQQILQKTTQSLEPVFNPLVCCESLSAAVKPTAAMKKQFYSDRAQELYQRLQSRLEPATISDLTEWTQALRSSEWDEDRCRQFSEYVSPKNNRIWQDTFVYIFWKDTAASVRWGNAATVEGVYCHESKDRYCNMRNKNVTLEFQTALPEPGNPGRSGGKWIIKDRNTVLMDALVYVLSEGNSKDDKPKTSSAPLPKSHSWRRLRDGLARGDEMDDKVVTETLFVIPDTMVSDYVASLKKEVNGIRLKNEGDLQYDQIDALAKKSNDVLQALNPQTRVDVYDDEGWYEKTYYEKNRRPVPLRLFMQICSPEGFLSILERASVWTSAMATQMKMFSLPRSVWLRHFEFSEHLFWPMFETKFIQADYEKSRKTAMLKSNRAEDTLGVLLHFVNPAEVVLERDCQAHEQGKTVLEVWCQRWVHQKELERKKTYSRTPNVLSDPGLRAENMFVQLNFRFWTLLLSHACQTSRQRRYLVQRLQEINTRAKSEGILERHRKYLPGYMRWLLKYPQERMADVERQDTRQGHDKKWQIDQITPRMNMDLRNPLIQDEVLIVDRPDVGVGPQFNPENGPKHSTAFFPTYRLAYLYPMLSPNVPDLVLPRKYYLFDDESRRFFTLQEQEQMMNYAAWDTERRRGHVTRGGQQQMTVANAASGARLIPNPAVSRNNKEQSGNYSNYGSSSSSSLQHQANFDEQDDNLEWMRFQPRWKRNVNRSSPRNANNATIRAASDHAKSKANKGGNYAADKKAQVQQQPKKSAWGVVDQQYLLDGKESEKEDVAQLESKLQNIEPMQQRNNNSAQVLAASVGSKTSSAVPAAAPAVGAAAAPGFSNVPQMSMSGPNGSKMTTGPHVGSKMTGVMGATNRKTLVAHKYQVAQQTMEYIEDEWIPMINDACLFVLKRFVRRFRERKHKEHEEKSAKRRREIANVAVLFGVRKEEQVQVMEAVPDETVACWNFSFGDRRKRGANARLEELALELKRAAQEFSRQATSDLADDAALLVDDAETLKQSTHKIRSKPANELLASRMRNDNKHLLQSRYKAILKICDFFTKFVGKHHIMISKRKRACYLMLCAYLRTALLGKMPWSMSEKLAANTAGHSPSKINFASNFKTVNNYARSGNASKTKVPSILSLTDDLLRTDPASIAVVHSLVKELRIRKNYIVVQRRKSSQ
ncbi:unnamed protein product [Amoebophrya sp. A120]|nr:unnamed protein product [Amoebophrya sp. A120]|eukprot:GSA120T00009463001.1